MDNNWAWNDCERCKSFKICYHKLSWGNDKAWDEFKSMVGKREMDLCINNGKRLFVDKEGAEQS